jgi:hypothetical protein
MLQPSVWTMLLWCLSGYMACAQPGLHLGFRAGPQYTALANQDDRELAEDTKRTPLILANASVYAGHYFRNGWGVQIGAGISQQGMRYEDLSLPDNSRSVRVRLSYFSIPILIGGSGQTRFKLQPSWNLGIQYNRLQTADWQATEYPTEAALVDPQAAMPFTHPVAKKLYKPYTLSAVAAFGVQYHLYQSIYAHAQVRAEYAMMDAEKKDAQDLDGTRFWETRLYGTPSRNAPTHPLGLGLSVGLSVVIDRKDRNHYQGY